MSTIFDALIGQYNFDEMQNHLDDGADVNEFDSDGRTVLMYSIIPLDNVSDGDMEKMVKLLLENGADVNMQDKGRHWTALHFAARWNRGGVIKLLLEAEAEVNATNSFGNTPLMEAITGTKENYEPIKLLLAAGADPNRENNYGESPLSYAKNIQGFDYQAAFGKM